MCPSTRHLGAYRRVELRLISSENKKRLLIEVKSHLFAILKVRKVAQLKIAFGRRNKDDEENASLTLAKRENEKQKLQVENLIGQNKKLVDVVVALQEELVKKDKVIKRKEDQIDRLIEKIGKK